MNFCADLLWYFVSDATGIAHAGGIALFNQNQINSDRIISTKIEKMRDYSIFS